RRSNHHRADLGVVEDLPVIVCRADGGMPLFEQSAAVRSLVCAPLYSDAVELAEISDEVWTPVAVADDTDLHCGDSWDASWLQSPRARETRLRDKPTAR